MLMVSSTEFAVGGNHTGWTIPKSADYYNNWASNNRFLVHDTLRFKYGEDSVIEVNEEDYNKCKASRPLFFSNNGDTVFTFDRPGLFFFISGVSGHCDRGQKIVVKVLDVQAHSPPPQNQNQNDDQNSPHTEAASSSSHSAGPFAKTTSALLVVSSFIFLLFA
ncbi:mavicyanin-like [Neltuma alba]|uniref:mavicyanin-like n=1 Tax=Neltuma alba TaxID=207710 RepID=UPI0010A3872E|nr:mavicyanin-like [Prosopis alba]XP_028753820.1 mavicyanin-like [Prosopis alba]XP_028783289.1 mavicyanin-like [Prosopis alba]